MTTLQLPSRDTFPAFPYARPYSIQLDLMKHLHSSIEDSKVTIIESPTGTGKTLSLLCASLQWLMDDRERARKGKMVALAEGSELDWVVQQTQERHRRELEAEEIEYEQRLAAARKKEAEMKRMANARVHKRPKLDKDASNIDDDGDDGFLPDDDSPKNDEDDNISPEVRALMAKFVKPTRHGPHVDEPDPTCTKIYYASRTHSQLTQVLTELRKLKFPAKIRVVNHDHTLSPTPSTKRPHADDRDTEDEEYKSWRTVALGSRKQLCINDVVRAKGGDLDEKCRELLGEKAEKRCPYLPPLGEDTRMSDFRDQILALPKDIEDLAQAGRLAHTCSYFGSRKAIPQAELVTLPYNLLLSKTAREALGIDLKDQVVIIDEAHNLISTLLSISTTRLTLPTLSTSLTQITIYLNKFKNRLKATHVLHLKRLVNMLSALHQCAIKWKEDFDKEKGRETEKTEVLSVADLMGRLGRKAEGINLLEIETYLRSSKIARKISGYSDKVAERAAGKDPVELARLRRGTTPPLHVVEAFLLALTATNDDGRIVFTIAAGEFSMKYQLLNPSTPFREIVESTRAVILAGGTMSPISDVVSQLFPYVPLDRISTFSCGHIIPPENLKTIILSRGPRGGDLIFKFDRRGDQSMAAELGQILFNLVSVVPKGMVVFLPSYGFFNAVKAVWETSGLMAKLSVKKKVFLEPQESSQVEAILRDYAAACQVQDPTHKCTGALLFAVIGAKLSEGLNFTDDLARAVVIVGMPYANLGSPELQERMKYVNKLQTASGVVRKPGAKDAASELYENMCMNSVNQSIGRAIRHQGDWASLVLVDRRYAATNIRHKLPKWINDGTLATDTFGQAIKTLGEFYRRRKLH